MARMQTSNYLSESSEGGLSASVYVPPHQDPEQLGHSFDAKRTIECLLEAIKAVESGDGIEATLASGEAFARICIFHRTQQ